MDEDSKQVSETTSHRAEAERIRRVAEPSIWTDGMLDALIDGVKGGKWYSRMDNHRRWPNAFFAELGLFSMKTAWERIIQSL